MRAGIGAFILVCLMLLAPHAAATPTSSATATTLGTWTGHLVISTSQNCDYYSTCGDLEDISIVTLDVGAVADSGPDGWRVKYQLDQPGGGSTLTAWRLCQYRDTGAKISCQQANTRLIGDINVDTHYVRIILVQNANVDYFLKLYALAP